jgi:hypothetical protein
LSSVQVAIVERSWSSWVSKQVFPGDTAEKGGGKKVAWGCGLEDNTIQGLIALIRGSRGIISVSHHAGTLK